MISRHFLMASLMRARNMTQMPLAIGRALAAMKRRADAAHGSRATFRVSMGMPRGHRAPARASGGHFADALALRASATMPDSAGDFDAQC